MLLLYRWPLLSRLFNTYLDKLPVLNQLGMNQFFFARPIQNDQRGLGKGLFNDGAGSRPE